MAKNFFKSFKKEITSVYSKIDSEISSGIQKLTPNTQERGVQYVVGNSKLTSISTINKAVPSQVTGFFEKGLQFVTDTAKSATSMAMETAPSQKTDSQLVVADTSTPAISNIADTQNIKTGETSSFSLPLVLIGVVLLGVILK